MRRFSQHLMILGLITLSMPMVMAGKGNGKGNGGGGGGDGGSSEPAVAYEIVFVGNPTGGEILGGSHKTWGGSAFGEVVGRVTDSDGAYTVTYYSLDMGAVDLTATTGFQAWPGWTSIGATDINEMGQIALLMEEVSTGTNGLFRYSVYTDTMELLVYDVGRYEARINNCGDVAFRRPATAGGPQVLWIYSQATQSAFPLLDLAGEYLPAGARSINDQGEVVFSLAGEAIRYDFTTMTLTKLANGGAGPNNESGDVALLVYGRGKYKSKPAVYDGNSGSITELANEGTVGDINNQGDVAGTGPNGQGLILYLAGGAALKIDSEVSGEPDDVFEWGTFSTFGRLYLSDRDATGYPTIIGKGAGDERLFFLTPLPTP